MVSGNSGISAKSITWHVRTIRASTMGSIDKGKKSKEIAPPPPTRTHEMTCWQIWINEDNAFEFVFVWEYANNNHVEIYDMSGSLVFKIYTEKGNAHFVAEVPDGRYTVKTFHEAGHILQEFVIGKP